MGIGIGTLGIALIPSRSISAWQKIVFVLLLLISRFYAPAAAAGSKNDVGNNDPELEINEGAKNINDISASNASGLKSVSSDDIEASDISSASRLTPEIYE